MISYVICAATGLKNSRHFFIRSEVKPKPIETRSHALSRALHSSFDWFSGLALFFVIGQSYYFNFGFTILNRKPLLKS